MRQHIKMFKLIIWLRYEKVFIQNRNIKKILLLMAGFQARQQENQSQKDMAILLLCFSTKYLPLYEKIYSIWMYLWLWCHLRMRMDTAVLVFHPTIPCREQNQQK